MNNLQISIFILFFLTSAASSCTISLLILLLKVLFAFYLLKFNTLFKIQSWIQPEENWWFWRLFWLEILVLVLNKCLSTAYRTFSFITLLKFYLVTLWFLWLAFFWFLKAVFCLCKVLNDSCGFYLGQNKFGLIFVRLVL